MPAYKYTLKNGKTRWYASFYTTDWTGKNKRVVKRGFKTQREAKEYERSQLDQELQTDDILFSSLVKNYLVDMENRLKPTTMHGKRHIIRTKIMPYFENLKVCDITPLHITKWQNEILTKKSNKEKPFSQTYMKTINNELSAIFSYACKNYGLSSNPCKIVGSIGKSKAPEMNFWTREQYDTFISYEKKDVFRLAFDILFYTGIRLGEMLALTPADITEDRYMVINKNYVVVEREEMFLLPKTDKGNRRITIPVFLYEEIQEYISTLYGINENERIFYFGKYAVENEFKRTIKLSGLPRIRVHDLRHSHASMLIHMGVPPKEVANRLGHESVKTTLDTYGHLYPNTDTDIAARLDDIGRLRSADSEEDSAE